MGLEYTVKAGSVQEIVSHLMYWYRVGYFVNVNINRYDTELGIFLHLNISVATVHIITRTV